MHLDPRRRTDRFRALLVDVGGTLVPDHPPDRPERVRILEERLVALLPELAATRVAALLAEITADASGEEQLTEARIAARLAAAAPGLGGRAGLVRRALSRRTGYEWAPFPGYRELLVTAGELGLRRVIVSNTAVTSAEDWWAHLPALDLHGLVDGVVTSFDVGRRKPDAAVFERALAEAGCEPSACIFIGDSERNDVVPARDLGMTVIRAAIQEPATATRAHHVVTSLAQARELLVALFTNA